MCKQRTVLDTLKSCPGGTGLTPEALLLHEKQCEDFESMQREINEIKQDVSCVKQGQAELKKAHEETNAKMDNVIALLEKKSSLKESVKEILNNRVFLYILVSIICAAFGASTGKVGLEILMK